MIVEGYSTASPLVIAGGGYDRCEDTDSITTVAGVTTRRNHSCTAASKGNKIYVIDAVAGTLVKAFDTDRAVIGDVTLVRDGAGRVTMGYAADLGGNVYRLRFAGASAAWTIRKIAALGCDDPAQGDCSFRPSTRKFMFAPSVVTADDGVTYSILLGSGDREKPTADSAATRAVANHFFMLQDRPGDASWLDAEATAAGCGLANALLCRDSLALITAGIKPTDAALSAKKGWYLGLTSGEQVVTSALTLFGVTTFSTSQAPLVNAETCRANLGTTRVYNINYLNAFSASNEALPYGEVAGGGLPPSPVGGQVKLEDGRVVSFCIGCRTESPLESQVAPEPSTSVKPLNRVFWFLRQ
jgi:type IV pilus assembly protein PilY1